MSTLLHVAPNFIAFFYLGKLKNVDDVASAGMGMIFQINIVFATIYALNQNVYTFTKQGYYMQEFKKCGLYLNKAFLVILFVYPGFCIFALVS